MRKLFIFISITAFALSSVQAQNLDQILKDHYKASGQEKMSKVKTIITKGISTYAMAGIEAPFSLYQARPNMVRMQAEFQGSKIITTFNGTTGWMYAPAMGISQPQELGGEELKSVLDQANFESPLWNYKEKENTVELAGSSDDGSAHKVKLTKKDGESMTILIDKKSHLMTGMTSVQVMGGAEAEVEMTMKDYKSVKGIQTPYYMATKMDGEIMSTIVIESVEYDKAIDPALFEKPAVE